jgi:uncharacterized protein (TIGR02466 family)
MELHSIFPTSIGKGFINLDIEPILQQAFMLRRDNASVQKSNKNGWQSPALNGNMLNELCPEVQNLVGELLSKANFMASVAFNSQRLGLSNFWFNINPPNSYNVVHSHAGAVLSAVFYIKVPENSGDIEFHRNDGLELLPMIPKNESFNELSSTYWRFEPREKMYLMFPGTAMHSVALNNSKEERVSIAFNFSAVV